MRGLCRILWILAAGSPLAGCGCNDIGCPSGVIVEADSSVRQLTLETPTGAIDCPSTTGACSRVALDDGRVEFMFHVVPTSVVEVRAKDAAGATVFEGALSLAVEQVEVGPDACESECAQGRGTLPR